MRSFEMITSEANGLESRLQPKRHRTAFIQRKSEGIPGDPGIVVLKATRSSVVQRSFSGGVHNN